MNAGLESSQSTLSFTIEKWQAKGRETFTQIKKQENWAKNDLKMAFAIMHLPDYTNMTLILFVLKTERKRLWLGKSDEGE